MISVTIDGRVLQGQSDDTILDVARRNEIEIPALCAEERLPAYDSCGVCSVEVEGKGVVRACSTPIADGLVVHTASEPALAVRKAALELLLSNHWGDCIAPCQQACPARTDCQAYVSLAGNGRFLDGLKILYEQLPLPASFGRICPAPCEDACRRVLSEEPVQIRHMKRFLADMPSDYVPSVAADTGKRVIVVGGGPAGLSAAYFLRRCGHEVNVLDAMPHMGGMLRYGIPEYRLPQAVIDRELDVLQRMGITFRNGVRLGKDVTCQQLEKQCDAVFLGLGAWGERSMGVPGEDHPAIMQGTEFLRRVNSGERPTLPHRVAVIGGGNTAMDAARCARRLGAEVVVVYRRTEDEMPALGHEVEEAKMEGVTFRLLTQPVEFLAEGEALRGMRCVQMELGEPDATGRRRPVPVEGSEWDLDVQAALLAVGQGIDTRCLDGCEIQTDRRGGVVVDERTGRTSRPKVFAGGDVVTGPSIAVEAIGAGHRAADAIDRFLRGKDVDPSFTYSHVKHDVTPEDIGSPANSPRIRTATRPVSERLQDFEEYETGLEAEQAVTAGQRCLECGCMVFDDCALRDYATSVDAIQDTYAGELPHSLRDERHPFIVRKVGKCVTCGRCLRTCDEVCGIRAIDFVGRGIGTEVQVPFNRAWQDSDCVSCGACVDVCPTGALYDRSVLDKQVPLDLDSESTICMLCGVGCEVRVLTLNGEYMRTEPADGRSVLCARGRYGWHALRDVPRITEPMIRCGTSHVRVSWDEALEEISKRLSAARSSIAVFGTGLLTCEEGWILAQLAEVLRAGPPIFDLSVSLPQVSIDPAQVVSFGALERADTIIVVGPRGLYKKVALDVRLRSAMQRGATLISVGAEVPNADVTLNLSSLTELLGRLDRSTQPPEAAGPPMPRDFGDRGVFVFEERAADGEAIGRIIEFASAHPTWKILAIPATANALGLRRLGFREQLGAASRTWLAVGADPISTIAGRRYQLGLETLIAVSPIPTETTERAHVVLPMCLPYETRGHVIGVDGRKEIVPCAHSPVACETWEVLLRLAGALALDSLPESFKGVVDAANAATAADCRMFGVGATPASIASIIDGKLKCIGIHPGSATCG